MSSKVEEALELFKLGFNCAQVVSTVFAATYGLERAEVLRTESGFGGDASR